jgi:hypothetical protein
VSKEFIELLEFVELNSNALNKLKELIC